MTRAGTIVAFVAAFACGGCNTTSESETAGSPPDAKAAILAHKNRLWKDADSIKGASITAPYRNMGAWHVCVRANAKNSYGAYAGEKENLIEVYDGGRAPEAIASDAPICESKAHTPFPELDGGYKAARSPKAK